MGCKSKAIERPEIGRKVLQLCTTLLILVQPRNHSTLRPISVISNDKMRHGRLTFNLPLDVVGVAVDHLLLVILVHPEEGGGRVVPRPQRHQVVLHQRQHSRVEALEALQHLERLAHQAVDVGQMLDGDVPLSFSLKYEKT